MDRTTDVTPESGHSLPAAAHDVGLPEQLAAAISREWEPAPAMSHPAAGAGAAPSAAAHRQALSTAFRGHTVVVAAGPQLTRANDTEFPFRADSTFTWLTGETATEAVLVMTPTDNGHTSTLFIREFAGAGQPAYFTDRRYGALWVGNVPNRAGTAAALGIDVDTLDNLPHALAAAVQPVLLGGADPVVSQQLPGVSASPQAHVVDELRLIKDDWEISRLRAACDATVRGFADVAAELPALLAAGGQRGERWLEGTFWRRARYEGNDVGYTSIVAAGPHATTLHWWRNDGPIVAGQLLLADMGVETDQLYTADVTRTMPVTGEWSPDQLQVYRAVQEAQQAGIAEVKAGADFLAAHRAAMWVLADHLHSWGILAVSADIATASDPERPGAGSHRRYTLHSVSHMLGIDVHDCQRARNEAYRDGPLQAGMVLTVEPGLYFQPNDLTIPASLRGIGVRIEDDIVVTNGEPINLSAALPRDPDEISAWMRDCASAPASRRLPPECSD